MPTLHFPFSPSEERDGVRGRMKMLLENQVAIVTGGTKGIGKAICLLFAEQGAKVVANFSKDVEAAEDLKKEAKSRGLSLGLFKADVTQFDQVKEMVEETFAQYGKIDILVNNVGLVRDNFLMLMSDEDWESLLRSKSDQSFSLLQSRDSKDDPSEKREDHQYLIYQRDYGHCGPGELCGNQRRDDQLHEIPCSRIGLIQHPCECSGSGFDRIGSGVQDA